MKVSKKFLSMLLVVAMVLSFSVISASAEPAVVVFGTGSSADDNQPAEVVTDVQQNEDQSNETETDKTADEVKDPREEDAEVKNPEAVIIGSEKTYKYATLKEAIAAAREGATIQVAKDITFSNTLYINKSVKIELAEATLTFKNSGSEVENAIVIDDGASVTIRNGEVTFVESSDKEGNHYGFVNGIVVEDGSAVLNDVDVNGDVVGGYKLSGDVTVRGGEFDFDPSAFVDEDYVAAEENGVFAVVEKTATYPAKGETAPLIIVPNQTIKLEKSGTLEELGLPATIDKNMTLDLAGFTLTGDITVAEGIKLVITGAAGSTFEGNITLEGGRLDLEGNVTVGGDEDGNIVMGSNSSLYVASSSVTVKGEVKVADETDDDTIGGSVIAGTFEKPTDMLKALIPEKTHELVGTVVKAITKSNNTVTDAYGNAYDADVNSNYIWYFKGDTELAPNQAIVFAHEAVFVLPSLSDSNTVTVKIDNSTVTDYTLDNQTKVLKFNVTNSVPVATEPDKTKTVVNDFDKLDAGGHVITFEFSNGGEPVEVPLFVYPSVVFDEYEYTQGGTEDYTVKVSDEPDNVIFYDSPIADLDKNPARTVLVKGEDWTFEGTTLTIKAATMNKLHAGEWTLSLGYMDSNNDNKPLEFASPVTVIAPVVATITPVDANKDNKWYNSNTALSYNVTPDVISVSVDGKVLDAASYTVSTTNVLSLKAEYLKTLGYGTHTLTVNTSAGPVSVEFTTGPSLVAGKNGSNHTKGGSKDLIFVASDPMNAVWVGKTQLKSDYYTISDDGKTITLKAAFLNTLKADNTYTITTAWLNSDGTTAKYSAATSFKILSATSAGATPKTGDTGVGLWVALLVMSGAAMAVIIPKRKEN